MNKYEKCVRQVKTRSPGYNPWAVCTAAVGRPKIYVGPRGGRYYLVEGRKVYV